MEINPVQIPKDCLGCMLDYLKPYPMLAFALTCRRATELCTEYVALHYPLLFSQQFPRSDAARLIIAHSEIYTEWHYKFICATNCYCNCSMSWKVGYACTCAGKCCMCGRSVPDKLLIYILGSIDVMLEAAWQICRFGCETRCINDQCGKIVNPAVKIKTPCLCAATLRVRSDGCSQCDECDMVTKYGKVSKFRVCERVEDSGEIQCGLFCRECDTTRGAGVTPRIGAYTSSIIDVLSRPEGWPGADATPRQIYEYDSLSPFGKCK